MPPSRQGVTLGAAVGALMTMAGFLIGSRPITDNSFFTHFANGRLFWEGSGIPQADPYSFTAAGEAVTVQSWLASIIYAGLNEFVGEWSLRAFNGLLCGLLAIGLWKLTVPAKHLLARVSLLAPAIVLGTLLWSPRPLLFGLLGMVAVLLAVDKQLPLWSLLPIMWIWVNTHGSFPLAVVLLGAVLGGQLLDEPGGTASRIIRAARSHEAKVLGWTTAGIALGALNPLGPRLLWFPVELLGKQEALRNVIEWSAPNFKAPAEFGFIGLLAALLVAAKLSASWRALVPGFLFVVAGLIAIRNVGPAAVVLVWAAAPALGRPGRLSLDGSVTGLLPKALFGLSGCVIVVSAAVSMQQGALDLRTYPKDEVTWLEERGLVASPEVRLLTRETDGNYLELRFGAAANVFVDDRFDFYPQPVLDDLDQFVFGGDFEEILDRNQIDVVLWQSDTLLADWIETDDQWFVAHRSSAAEDTDGSRDTWVIACRVGSDVVTACRS